MTATHQRPKQLASKRATRYLLSVLDHPDDETCSHCVPPRFPRPPEIHGKREPLRLPGWLAWLQRP